MGVWGGVKIFPRKLVKKSLTTQIDRQTETERQTVKNNTYYPPVSSLFGRDIHVKLSFVFEDLLSD